MKAWNTHSGLPRPRGCHITPAPRSEPTQVGGRIGPSLGSGAAAVGGPGWRGLPSMRAWAAGSREPRPRLLPPPGFSVPSLPLAFPLQLSVSCILPSPPRKSPCGEGTVSEAVRIQECFIFHPAGQLPGTPSICPHEISSATKQTMPPNPNKFPPLKSQMLKESCPTFPHTLPRIPCLSTCWASRPVRPVPPTLGLAGGPGPRDPGGEWWAPGVRGLAPGPGYRWCGIVSLLWRKALMTPATLSGWFKWT